MGYHKDTSGEALSARREGYSEWNPTGHVANSDDYATNFCHDLCYRLPALSASLYHRALGAIFQRVDNASRSFLSPSSALCWLAAPLRGFIVCRGFLCLKTLSGTLGVFESVALAPKTCVRASRSACRELRLHGVQGRIGVRRRAMFLFIHLRVKYIPVTRQGIRSV